MLTHLLYALSIAGVFDSLVQLDLGVLPAGAAAWFCVHQSCVLTHLFLRRWFNWTLESFLQVRPSYLNCMHQSCVMVYLLCAVQVLVVCAAAEFKAPSCAWSLKG
jgi:hypothetical protein